MYLSTLIVSGLCAVAMAVDEPVFKRQDNSVVSAALVSISSLEQLIQPPSSILAKLTGVPPDVKAAATNPALITSLESQFINSVPAWYTSLPADAQSYILGIGPKVLSIQPQIQSLQVVAGLITTGYGSGATATGTGTGTGIYPIVTPTTNGTISSDSTSTLSSSSTTTQTSSTSLISVTSPTASVSVSSVAAPSSTSKAGAAQATGTIAAGLFGAVGVLGLALAS